LMCILYMPEEPEGRALARRKPVGVVNAPFDIMLRMWLPGSSLGTALAASQGSLAHG
jgi:hypothetical protein